MDATTITPPEESLSSRWREVVLSGALFASGWVLFEFAAAPGVGVTVASLKFGWNDFLTALWLRRRDPDRDRSAVCFWFFVASGLWKITVVAFLLTILIGTAARQNGRPARRFVGSSTLLTVSGLALLTIVPVIGALRARQTGVRVWVNGSLHAYRRRNQWPVWPAGRNNVRGLLLASLILPMLVTAILVRFRGPAMLAALLAETGFLWMLARNVAARKPDEAWGTAWDPDFKTLPTQPEPALLAVDPDDEFRAPWARTSLADGAS
jgi:hypothetical protein